VLDLAALDRRQLRAIRAQIQMVFQILLIAESSTVGLRHHQRAARDQRIKDRAVLEQRVTALLESVGLARSHMTRFPNAFTAGSASGSESPGRWRFSRGSSWPTRRCPRSMFVQAQILNLFSRTADAFKLSYVFVAHDSHRQTYQ